MIRAADATWEQVRDHLATASGLAIFAFGALEQHGPHLPLATDTLTADAVATRLAERMDALLLPAVPYGDTWNNAGYPGTISLAPATVTAIATDIGRAAYASGARGVVIVNGDWGNRNPLYTAVRTLIAEGVPSIALDYPGWDAASAELRESPPAYAGLSHADEIETSIVLSLRPELVHPDRYVVAYPDFPADFGIRPMQLHPFSPSGVFGDPRAASAETGRALLDAVVDESERVLRAFSSTGMRG